MVGHSETIEERLANGVVDDKRRYQKMVYCHRFQTDHYRSPPPLAAAGRFYGILKVVRFLTAAPWARVSRGFPAV
jgi:hypothetical protein